MTATAAGSRSRTRKGKQQGSVASGTAACFSCGEVNKVSARFCQNCGRSLVDSRWFDTQKLTVLGAALVTLAALGLLFASVIDMGSPEREGLAATTPARTSPASSGQPPDLSTMTPREAADRLFNRVMMADEQGNADEVAQFAPMAVAAYEQLESLDLDALYHVGLINTATGNSGKAWDVVERLRAVVPGHLLASLLEHRLALDEKDQAKAEGAIERFKADYDEEIKVERPEYLDHRRQIDQFREKLGLGG